MHKLSLYFWIPKTPRIFSVVVLSEPKNLYLNKKIILSPLPYSSEIDMTSLIEKAEEEQNKGKEIPYPEEWYTYNIGGGLSENNHVTFLTIYFFFQ